MADNCRIFVKAVEKTKVKERRSERPAGGSTKMLGEDRLALRGRVDFIVSSYFGRSSVSRIR